MRSFSLLFFIFLTVNVSYATCKKDSSYSFSVNDSTQVKYLTGRTYNYYNGNFLRETVNLYLNTQVNAWENNYRSLYTEFADDLPETSIYMVWDIANKAWLNYQKTISSYNTAMKLTQSEVQNWDSIGKTWQNVNRIQYTFDTNGIETGNITQDWNGNTYVNSLKFSHVYDNMGLKSMTVVSIWNNSSNAWEQKSKVVYTYSLGLESEQVTLYWDAGTSTWNNSARILKSYHPKGQISAVTSQYWNNGWSPNGQQFYTYNTNGCPANFHIYSNWSEDDSTWGLHSEEVYFSSGFLSVSAFRTKTFSIYPNPASNILNISSPESAGYAIYQSNGAMVAEGWLKEGENAFDIHHLEAGIYLIKTREGLHKLLIQ